MADLSGSYLASMSQAGPRRHGMIEEGLLAITCFFFYRQARCESSILTESYVWKAVSISFLWKGFGFVNASIRSKGALPEAAFWLFEAGGARLLHLQLRCLQRIQNWRVLGVVL